MLFRHLNLLVSISVLCVATAMSAVVEFYPGVNNPLVNNPPGGWPASWTVLNDRNGAIMTDPKSDQGLQVENDLCGTASNPLAYWAQNSDYVFFRMRINLNTTAGYTSGTFGNDAFWVFVDNTDDRKADYAFGWDVNNETTSANGKHGLELNIPNGTWTTWADVQMEDKDGSNGLKLQPDLNTLTGHTQDGYVRLTNALDDTSTSFIDIAIDLAYLSSTYLSNPVTTLGNGNPWHLAFATMHGGTDHTQMNHVDNDIAGTSLLSSAYNTITLGANATADATWTTGLNVVVPEPASALVLIGGLGFLFRRRRR